MINNNHFSIFTLTSIGPTSHTISGSVYSAFEAQPLCKPDAAIAHPAGTNAQSLAILPGKRRATGSLVYNNLDWK